MRLLEPTLHASRTTVSLLTLHVFRNKEKEEKRREMNVFTLVHPNSLMELITQITREFIY